ncbi:helix-turn-helix domain-containing protein [Stappia sp. 22II-S9-Z10]|nr:helix-turn-helix domain-containing protein [Stappia sp. 22II-S9-Z10]
MVRLPDGLRERIKAAAESNTRSMNAEIVSTLMEAYPGVGNPEQIASEIRHLIKKMGDTPSAEQLDEVRKMLTELDYVMSYMEEVMRGFDGIEDRDPRE